MIDDNHVAIHEAGHAVVARVLGLPVSRVGLGLELCRMPLDRHKYPAGSKGICYTQKSRYIWPPGERPTATRTIAEVEEAFAIQCMAGAEAELAFYHEHQHGAADDQESIAQCIATAAAHGVTLDEKELRAKAAALVALHRPKIAAVAAELLERQVLDAGELEDAAFPMSRI
jgi:hypothetical protein